MSRFSVLFAVPALVFIVSGCVAIPTRDQPAAYTQSIVQDAIRLYNQAGRAEAVAHYSSPESVDGAWYVFIIDEDDRTLAHPNSEFIGEDLKGDLGVDITGYRFGDDMLRATAEGRWVDYVFLNPETGTEDVKHAWVVRHDGLIFGSGWYE